MIQTHNFRAVVVADEDSVEICGALKVLESMITYFHVLSIAVHIKMLIFRILWHAVLDLWTVSA